MNKKERLHLRQAGVVSSEVDILRLAEAGLSYEQLIPYFVRPEVAWFTAIDLIHLIECDIPSEIAKQYAAKRLHSPEIVVLYKNEILPDNELLSDYFYGFSESLVNSRSDFGFEVYPYYVLKKIPFSWYREYVSNYEKYPGKRTFQEITNAFVQEHTPKPILRELKKRYHLSSLGRYSPPLLEELVQNSDPDHNREKPVAIVLIARDDWNGLFHLDTDIYEHISRAYKLFINEVASPYAACNTIRTCGAYHGLTPSGNPSKPIELLLLCGHGNRNYLTLADFPKKKTLNIQHGKQLRAVASFVSGTIILNSCSTGQGGKDGENLATSIFSAMQPQQLYAPMEEGGFDLLAIDFQPRPVPYFTCGRKRTLVLERSG